jgi:acyl carrier protein
MTLHQRIKDLITSRLMLDVDAADFTDEALLVGPQGIGLDSVDMLQLVVEIEKEFGLKITDPDVARKVLQNVNTLAAAIEEHQSASA